MTWQIFVICVCMLAIGFILGFLFCTWSVRTTITENKEREQRLETMKEGMGKEAEKVADAVVRIGKEKKEIMKLKEELSILVKEARKTDDA